MWSLAFSGIARVRVQSCWSTRLALLEGKRYAIESQRSIGCVRYVSELALVLFTNVHIGRHTFICLESSALSLVYLSIDRETKTSISLDTS